MLISYEGPSRLAAIMNDTFRAILADYDRRDPRVIVGFQQTPGQGDVYKKLGFESRGEFNEFVNEKVRQLQTIRRYGYRARNDLSREKRIIQDLKTASFFVRGFQEGSALYDTFSDAIYIDAFNAALFLLGDGTITSDLLRGPRLKTKTGAEQRTLLEYASHELVHNELGLDMPAVIMRAHYCDYAALCSWWEKTDEASKRGPQGFQMWRDGEGKPFFESLQARHGSEDYDAARAEALRLKRLIEQVYIKKKELGIDAAEEALAYNFGLGFKTFDFWLRNIRKQNFDRALALYNNLESRINANGKVGTLRQMRLAIDTSWTENRGIIDLLL